MWHKHQRKRAASTTLLKGRSRPATHRERGSRPATYRGRGMHVHSLFPSYTDAAPARCILLLWFVLRFAANPKWANSREGARPCRPTRKESIIVGVRTPNTVIIFVPGPTQHLSPESEKTETGHMTLPASCCRLVSQGSCVFLDTTRYICNKERDPPCTVYTTPSGVQTLAFFCGERACWYLVFHTSTTKVIFLFYLRIFCIYVLEPNDK